MMILRQDTVFSERRLDVSRFFVLPVCVTGAHVAPVICRVDDTDMTIADPPLLINTG